MKPEDAYARRIQKVVDFITTHLDEELTVERLAEVAGFSKFHFHRQFAISTGYTTADLIRRLRLRRAAFRLAFDRERRIVEVALEAGFAAHEAFSRAFKDAVGQTPSAFRAAPDWTAMTPDRPLPFTIRSEPMNPEIILFEEVRVAALEHEGPPSELMNTVGRFITWRKASGESPVRTSRTFGLIYNDPERTPPAEFRFDVCGELSQPLRANAAGVVEKVIPRGRCARVRHVGSTDAIGETVKPLYSDWLPKSGERPRDFPLFFHYVIRMPDVAEHEQVTDVYLPLEG
ncbi:MAG: AraC family transcriptional regulator [Polyangiaceae bacterium]